MRNAKPVNPPTPPVSNPPAPSVPISLYREVATELQSARTVMESLKLQNQQLLQQNQQLRIEIERVVQSALQLRQVADGQATVNPAIQSQEPTGLELHFSSNPVAEVITPAPAGPTPPQADSAPAKKPLFTGQQEPLPRRSTGSDRPAEVGGWWLALVIFLIVLTAFGTGFLIVRPLLPNR